MAKGYSARRGFSNGSGQMLKQQQMQQQIMKMQEDMQKACLLYTSPSPRD